MKFSRRDQSSGFFEVFSDLIFGVMAIFVLLFVIILTQIKPQPRPQPAVDLVVAIDVSGSMREPLKELNETLQELAENFPDVIRDFRIGVVSFAQRLNSSGVDAFPLRVMDDAGKAELIAWLSKLKHGNSLVDTNAAINAAIAMHQTGSEDGRRRSLVLIGDVGPFELQGQRVLRDTSRANAPINRAFESTGIQAIRSFAASDPENRVLTIFSGAPTAQSSNGSRVRSWAYEESQAFFCSAAAAAGPQGRYSEQAYKMVWTLLETFINNDDIAGNTGVTC
ncbi:MAG: vWA domain-containing protein [Pseudomonadota bacterium]